MSVKTEYKCDVCRDPVPETLNLYGVRFTNMKDFKLGDPIGHNGVHICKRCVQQIVDQATEGKSASTEPGYDEEGGEQGWVDAAKRKQK